MPPDAGFAHYLVEMFSLDKIIAFCYRFKIELFISAVIILEWVSNANLRRYWSRSFASDAFHVLFYVGGFAALLIFNPMFSFLDPHMSWLKLGLLSDLPPALAFVLFFIYADFFHYWFHRLQHTNRYLWIFHSVHHSATHLTGATSFRRHIGETLVGSLIKYALIILPLLGVLNPPWPVGVLLFTLAIEFTVILQHAELNWHFGPFSRLLVSPVFHSVHHSLDEEHHDKNFGMVLSTWDYLFGTAVEVKNRSGSYGLDDKAGVPDTFNGQVLAPFKMLINLLRPGQGTERVAP